jgi:lipopolysaccharide biosynthesis protein
MDDADGTGNRPKTVEEFASQENMQLEIQRLNSIINAMQASRSWALTKPFRAYAALRREDAVDRMVKRYEAKLTKFPKSITISASQPILGAKKKRSDYTVGAIIHVHFIDVLDTLIGPLSQISNLNRIFITYNNLDLEERIRNVIARHLSSDITSTLLLVENRGRDVLPFLKLLDHLDLNPDQRCDAYLKLHTKKSGHLESGGDVWRDGLVRSLVPYNVDEIAQYVASNSNLGFVSPLRWTAGAESWGRNKKTVNAFMKRGGYSTRTKLLFPAGTMFWFNSNLIDLLQPINIQSEEFEVERGQLDGTAAHAFERIVGRVSIAEQADIWLIH